ncbi:MAG: HAMP domain-containing histidine kinase [Candidatus Zixiibacteriota bacterium]|nr:MAG: HAMP domain-containing histidine kinase [candidate division Zixibacteria bacterium]
MRNSINIRYSFGGTTFFKLFLLLGIVLISIVFIYYTLDVINQLKSDAERMVRSYVMLWQLAASESTSGGEVQVIFEEVIKKANFPVVIADLEGEPVFWRNIDGIIDNDPDPEAREKVRKIAREMKEDNGELPLKFGERTISYFYYGDSHVIRQLRLMPFIELGLVGAFILVGFIGFQNIKRSEERHIWVGMAKETAHQLGTPISSLMGWLELLLHNKVEESEAGSPSDINDQDIFRQMKADVNRLQRVANRFGQIGSRPELKDGDLSSLLEETAAYYRRRLPFNGKGVEIICRTGDIPHVSLNGELITWAIENLIKNGLQAVDPQKGRIELISVQARDPRFVVIEICDNGKGIPPGTARKLFRPGFTTKKRGWGLGLTLARRIVEEYHRGKISLVKSRPGETVFQIVLPVKGTDSVRRRRYGALSTPKNRL